MRLIDADVLKHELCIRQHMLNADSLWKTLEIMDAQPTADVVERKKGKWSIEETNTYELSYGVTAYAPVYKCSACGRSIESHLMLDEPIVPEDANFSRFCPWCGAEMEE